ncbi:MAG TPA: ABC transporter substrate-binding protein [Candidatus Binatia bacterium]|nr:ABC transporter substrate-binding protein [Candidatus Binatia bacterium]
MLKILVVLLSTFIFHASVHAANKIRIGYGAGTGSLLILLAHKKGFLKAEGFDAEVIRMTANVPIAALLSDEIDYNAATAGIRGAIQGLPLRIVATHGEGSGWILVSGANAKSVAELRGKVIAVGNPGSGPDTAGRVMVKHFGLEPDRDVKFVAAADGLPEGRLLRVQQRLIDATVVPIPADVTANKFGLNVIARSSEIHKLSTFGLVTTSRKIHEKRDEVKRMIVAGIKASRYIKTNREPIVQFLMELFRTDREMAGANYDFLAKTLNDNGSPTDNGFRLLLEEMKDATKVTRNVSVSEVADFSILREAQRELGIVGK